MINKVSLPKKVGTYPTVTVTGRHIHVARGELRMGAQEFTLTEDEEFDALERPDPTCFLGYIVRMKSGEIRLLVDEVSVADPRFDFATNEIECLQMLFSLETQPGVSGFTEGRIKQNAQEEVADGDA
jgi:hypothetical protein